MFNFYFFIIYNPQLNLETLLDPDDFANTNITRKIDPESPHNNYYEILGMHAQNGPKIIIFSVTDFIIILPDKF